MKELPKHLLGKEKSDLFGCDPREIKLLLLIGSLKDVYKEKVIIGIIGFSQKQGEWCGIEQHHLLEELNGFGKLKSRRVIRAVERLMRSKHLVVEKRWTGRLSFLNKWSPTIIYPSQRLIEILKAHQMSVMRAC